MQRIKALGKKAGVALNPATPVETLFPVLGPLDFVLVMSVNPGFGGQRFIPTSTQKIAALRRELDERGLWPIELEVDGGIAENTIGDVVSAGATVVVAGAAVYNDRDTVQANIKRLRSAAESP